MKTAQFSSGREKEKTRNISCHHFGSDKNGKKCMANSGGGGQGRMWLVNSKCAVDGEDGDNEYLLNPMTLMTRSAQFSEASLGPSSASVLVTISRASLPSTEPAGCLPGTARSTQTPSARHLTQRRNFPRQEPNPSLETNAPLSPGHCGFALYPENCLIFK